MSDETKITTQNGESTELVAPSNFGQGLAYLNPSEMPDLEKAEVGISIQPQYHEFTSPGDMVRGIFNGMGHITKKELQKDGSAIYKDIPAIVLQTKTGIILNAGASLVNQFSNLPVGTPVQVMYKGEEKTQSGNKVKTYDVHLLSIAGYTNKKEVKSEPTKREPTGGEVQRYWSGVYELGWSNIDGKQFLEENGGDFVRAYNALPKIGEA